MGQFSEKIGLEKFKLHALGCALVMLLMGLPRSTCASNDATTLLIGKPVRISSADPTVSTMVGVMLRSTGDSLVIMTSKTATPILLDWEKIESLEVLKGTRRRWSEGLQYGAFAGAIAGGIGGAVTAKESDPCPECFLQTQCWSRSCRIPRGILLGLVSGAVAGGIIGAIFTTDNWEPVHLNNVRIGVLALPSEASIQLSMRWHFRQRNSDNHIAYTARQNALLSPPRKIANAVARW